MGMRKSEAIPKKLILRTAVAASAAGVGGTMQSRNDGDREDPDSFDSNVRAIFFQLLSARASLLRLYPEEICLAFMDDCIAAFKARYHLVDRDTDEGIVWEETSMEALLRLLEYLHDEIAEGLKDQSTAQLLMLCIHRLTQILML